MDTFHDEMSKMTKKEQHFLQRPNIHLNIIELKMSKKVSFIEIYFWNIISVCSEVAQSKGKIYFSNNENGLNYSNQSFDIMF